MCYDKNLYQIQMGMVKAITWLTQMMGQFFSQGSIHKYLQQPLKQSHIDREYTAHPTQQVMATHHSTPKHKTSIINHAHDGTNEEYEPIEILPFDY
jgi:hypothetical protein